MQPAEPTLAALPNAVQRYSLATRPALLLLDEVIAGLTPTEGGLLMDLIGRIRSGGVTILLDEQNVRHALEVSRRAYVLETGRIVLEGAA